MSIPSMIALPGGFVGALTVEVEVEASAEIESSANCILKYTIEWSIGTYEDGQAQNY